MKNLITAIIVSVILFLIVGGCIGAMSLILDGHYVWGLLVAFVTVVFLAWGQFMGTEQK